MNHSRGVIGVILCTAFVSLAAWAEVPELFKAAGAGDLETVQRLLEAGADPEGRTPSGVTALIIAASEGHTTIVRVLLEAGADVNAATVGEPAASGRTALHFAAQNGNGEIVTTLLASEAAVDARTGQGFTPLHLAAESGHTETVRALVKAGAETEARNADGATPLVAATMKDQTGTALALLELGADASAATNGRFSPLMIAAYLGNEHLVGALIGEGADISYADGEGNTALDYATMKQRSGIRYRLLDAGATAKRTGLKYGEDIMAGEIGALTDDSITVVAPEDTRTFLIGPDTRLCAGGRETDDLGRIRGAETVTVLTGMNERTARRIDNRGFTMKLKGQEWVTEMPECSAVE